MTSYVCLNRLLHFHSEIADETNVFHYEKATRVKLFLHEARKNTTTRINPQELLFYLLLSSRTRFEGSIETL